MAVPSHLVNSPPNQQGSVLARYVAGDSRLGQLLYWIAFCNANARLLASVQAELAALRATKLFSFTVGNDIETPSGKSVLELCWETLERVQHLTRRIALYPEAYRERIERSGKFHYFLIRVAGIAGGPVAESKAMAPRYDRRVRDKEAEAACPNYLVESFGYQPEEKGASESVRSFDTNWVLQMMRMSVGVWDGWEFKSKEIVRLIPTRENRDRGNWVRVNPPVSSNFWTVLPEPSEKRFAALPVKPWVDSSQETFLSFFGELLESTREEAANRLLTNKRNEVSRDEYAARHKNGELGRYLPYWCPDCKEYSAGPHDGPGGIDCEDRLATIAEKRAAKLADRRKKKNRATTHRVSAKHLQPRGRGATGINRQEDLAARRADAAFKRWLTESKMVEQRHPNAPPRVRPLEKIVSEGKYFPI